jgi:prolyl oligopeptidase
MITDDGKYLLLSVGYPDFATSRYYVRRVDSDGEVIRLLDQADAMYEFAGNEGDLFYFKTDLDAPNSRLVAIDINNPEQENWKTIIPEQSGVMDTVFLLHDQFVVNWKIDAHHVLSLYSKDARKIKDIELPSLGAVGFSSAKQNDTEFFYTFTSFLYPASSYRYDMNTGKSELVLETEIGIDTSQYETKQVFYPSKDGTKIPMFITHKKGVKLDGNNPILLYGYGGFDISLMPSFSIARIFWIEQGGVFALANLRGGSEYGKNWHEAGMLEKKQNVFDDFHAAAEYLITEKYTSPKKLAIQGGSNGGLLTAACMLQRPDLYGAVHSAVPVIDMLRFHKFTIGFYWTGEYGNAEENPEHFKFMYAYSPLHNVKEGVSYPPVLVTAADTDDRVVPSHAKKFVATLQEKALHDHPILLRIETKAGHGAGKPTSKQIEEQADIYAFLFKQFGMSMNDSMK